jgi:uncharacterized membrane protein
MASSKAKPGNRPAAKNNSGRPSAKSGGTRTQQVSRSRSQERREELRQQRRERRAAAAAAPVQEPAGGPPKWLWVTSFVLAIIGLGVSAYLTYEHYTEASGFLGCPETSTINCQKVTTSSQSMIFGAIPVALTGLLFYVFVVAIMSPWAWMSKWRWMPQLRLATMVSGMGMVLYLVYAELFQIGAICLYCTSVHVITFLLFSLIVISFAIWGFAAPEEDTA